MHQLCRFLGAKGNLKSARAEEVEEKFDILVDANDQLLERVVGVYVVIVNYIYYK